jgi:hypothetical protein
VNHQPLHLAGDRAEGHQYHIAVAQIPELLASAIRRLNLQRAFVAADPDIQQLSYIAYGELRRLFANRRSG